ncbi:MAG: acyl-[ACP]--phospholipid O-acyltransferase [Thermodesulfobacteriota bacterium]|jgi:acyl-[acyl-carrier-protein]-phospholipid O-acyltransferase/long-chain-fatty-acid--[acyl-carrier-protein] ligase|nr:MAG: acyl-[ACP]--phospholipid O-acyltransferase [Thermodesulfobacteriota bacterium]
MFEVLKIRGFLPYLLIVFLNAFNELGHKIIIQNTVFKYFSGPTQIILTAVVNALILLPFVMLFTPAGYLSDKYPKDKVIKVSAVSAFVLAIFITVSFYAGWFKTSFILIFILAIQAAFLSPAKYGYIKELAGKENIAIGNAFVQAVSIAAILLGVFIYSILFEKIYNPDFRTLSDILTSIAPLGYLIIVGTAIEALWAFTLPQKTETKRELAFDRKQYVTGNYLKENLRAIKGNEVIWLSIIGLAIFWGINQVVFAAFGAYLKETADVTNTVIAQGLMAIAGIGVIVGSLLAGKVSKNYIETGMIPASAIGITVLLFLLPSTTSIAWFALLFFLYGIAGGMFIVPLNSLIQFNAKGEELGKVLAGNNFLQNAVMLFFLVLAIGTALKGIGSVYIFKGLFIIAFCGAVYTFIKLPQSFIRYVIATLVSQHYKLQVIGMNNIPSSGGVLMLGNHTSYLDWAIVQMACPRRVRFVMYRGYYEKWFLKKFLDFFGVVPISSSASREAIDVIEKLLNQGEVVVLFPEGALSRNGQVGVFHRGFELAIKNAAAVIIPFYLRGLWGSLYSFATPKHREMSRLKRTRDVSVCFGKPLSRDATAAEVKKAVLGLSIHSWLQYSDALSTIPIQWLKTAKKIKNEKWLIDFDGTSFSSHRLLTAAIVFAQALKKKLRQEHNVGLLLPTSSGGIIANLSVLMLGKTVVNLNYTASQASLMQAVEQAEIKTILTSKRFVTTLNNKGFPASEFLADKKVVFLEELREQFGKISLIRTAFLVKLLPAFLLKLLYSKKTSLDDVAAIVFSSGSEGLPKGVQLTHRNIVGNIKQVASVLNFQESDVLLSVLPLFHSFGLTVTSFLPLVEGIPVVCHPDPTNAYAIGKLVAEHRATILCSTSTFLRLYNKNKKLHPLMFESLRLVVAGAEKLSGEVREDFKAKFGLDIYEGYGVTETTPVASVNLPDVLKTGDWSVQQGTKIGTVGLPLPGTSFKIVDPATLEELPAGEAGLILVGGPQIMAGYLKNEKKTQEVIVEKDGIRWYKTGDKGQLDDDGFLTILDRYSRFAKIGGEMISLGAVEEAVAGALDNKEMELAVVALPDAKKGEKIVLLFAGEIDPAVIRQKLIENKVDPLMLPDSIIKVESIPKLGSGKADFSQAKALAQSLA